VVVPKRVTFKIEQSQQAYDVVQELLRGKKGGKPLSQHYANFLMVFEEFRVLFSIFTYLRKMQLQWEKLMFLC